MEINIVRDFTDTPGGRYKSDGKYSGEEFFNSILLPKYEKLGENEKLLINFDGSYGYPVSFLEEVFGGLSRKFGYEDVLNKLEFISDDEPKIIEDIKRYIKNA